MHACKESERRNLSTEIILAATIAAAFYILGYNKGSADGMDAASGWRDKLIEELHTAFNEAIRQRDEARANRIVLPPPPNPFASKEWN